MAKDVDIKLVESRSQWRQFFSLPEKIYQKDPCYVAPLVRHIKILFKSQPGSKAYIACRDGEPVARVACRPHDSGAFVGFGFFECLEGEQQVGAQLLVEVGRKAGVPLRGPFHFRQEDPFVGLLIQGSHQRSYFLMSYNPPFYQEIFRLAGLNPIMDLHAFEMVAAKEFDPKVHRLAQIGQKRYEVQDLQKWELRLAANHIAGIFNQALKDNWGFEEFQQEQIDELVDILKFFIDRRAVFLALDKGRPVGALVFIPDYNEILSAYKGMLTPRMLWRIWRMKNNLQGIRAYALAVLPEYRNTPLSAVLAVEARQRLFSYGYRRCEVGWVLDSNTRMMSLMEAFGYESKKTYRIYSSV